MTGLTDLERECVDRYCRLLAERLGGDLAGVRIFGSVARGDMWPAYSPMHSDIDLLVIARRAVDEAEIERLVNESCAFYLECGRQISPHFFTEARLAAPEDERTRAFLAAVAADWIEIWPTGPHAADPSARTER